MRISNMFITTKEKDLLDIFNRFLNGKNIFIEEIKINKSIIIKNIRFKKFKDISIILDLLKVVENKIYIKLSKIRFKHIYIPNKIINLIFKIFISKFAHENILNNNILIIDLTKYVRKSNMEFKLNNISINKESINIYLENIFVKNNTNKIKIKNKEGIYLRLTQTTLKLSGEDIMSFVRDFVKTDKFIISGIDVSQALYLKGIIINSFDFGDVSINIKDLSGNLLHLNIKIINSLFPGVNIEHIPIKISVKELLKAFNNLNLDFDINSVKFIDGCIEVKVNNFSLDMRKLPNSSNNVFLK